MERIFKSNLPLPLFSENQLILRPDRKRQLYDIRDQLQDADDIVIASDAGSEGELSQRQILSYVLQGRQRLKKPNRMWLRSMSITDINEAYGQLLGVTREEDMSLARLYDSGRARILLDRYMAHNYSRLISLTGINGISLHTNGRMIIAPSQQRVPVRTIQRMVALKHKPWEQRQRL